MPTALSHQLAQFKGFVGKERTKASLIHDPKDAANLSAEDIFRASVGGFQELCKKDSRFEPYERTLFAGVPKEREQRTKAEDERVNESITGFLRILVDHFLEPSAFKALEHLIRSYKRIHLYLCLFEVQTAAVSPALACLCQRVNEYNVDALLGCALAYHETREFVDLMGTLHLDGTIWGWLKGVQKVGVPLPRSSLVQKCTKDTAVLSFLCEMAKWSAEGKYSNQRVLPLYATVVCEVLITVPQVTEELMLCLVKFVITGLINKSQDYRSASYMIVVTLAEHAALSDKLMAGILEALVSGARKDQWSHIVTIMAHLYKTQDQYETMSNSVLKSLISIPDFPSMLGGLVQRGLDAGAFIKALWSKLFAKSLEHPRHSSTLCDLLASVKLSNKMVAFISKGVISKGLALDEQKHNDRQELLASIIRALDCHYPEQLDKAVNKRLTLEQNSKKMDTSGDRKKLMEYMQRCLVGSLHQPISNDDNVTLLMAVDTAQASTRKLALQQLQDLIASGSASNRIKTFANEAILRRLEDDDVDVVSKALCCSYDETLGDPLAYHNAVKEAFARASLKVAKQQPQWGQIVEQSLTILSKSIRSNPKLADAAFSFLIGYVVVRHDDCKLSDGVVKVLGQMPAPYGPLVNECLAKGGEQEPQGKGKGKGRAKGKGKSEKDSDGKVDESAASKLISNLVPKLGDSLGSFMQKTLPLCSHRGLHTLFLSMNHGCLAASQPTISTIALKCVNDYWNLMSSATPGSELQQTGQCANPIKSPTLAAGQALHQVLHSVLLGVQAGKLEKLSNGQLQGLLVRMLTCQEWEKFGPHIKELLNIVAGSKFEFLAEMAGSPESVVGADVIPRALRLLFQLLKDKAPGTNLSPVVLACVLGCMGSPLKAVRQLVVNNFQGLSHSFQTNGIDESELSALAKAIHQASGSIQGSPSGILATLTSHRGSFKGILETIYHSLGALTGVGFARTANLMVALFKGIKNGGQLLQDSLHFVKQLSPPGAPHPPTSTMCELGITVLSLYGPGVMKKPHGANLEALIVDVLTSVQAAQPGNPDDGMAVDGIHGNCSLTFSDVRVAAFERMVHIFHKFSPTRSRAAAFDALVESAAADPDLNVRKAARECLEKVVVLASDIIPSLELASPEDQKSVQAPKRRKSGSGQSTDLQEAPFKCTSRLELILWKETVGQEELLPPVQQLLHKLLGWLKTGKEVVWADTSLEYLCRLCLSALERLVERINDNTALENLEEKVVVEFLRNAPDGSLRNEAMGLLRAMMDKLPGKSLDHILEILKLMGDTGILEDNAYSRMLATDTLAVAVPAWIQAGKSMEELWMAMLSFLPGIQQTHRMSVLMSLLKPMPQVEGCATGLVSLLKAHAAATSDDHKRIFIPASIELARSVPISIRSKALAACLGIAMRQATEGEASAFQVLREAMKFIIREIQFLVSATAHARSGHVYDAALSSTCQDLLHEAVKQFSVAEELRITQTMPQTQRHEWRKVCSMLLEIIAELNQQMDALPYIQSVVGFMGDTSEAALVLPKALKMYIEKMNDVEAKGVEYYGHDYIQEMASTALSICEPVKKLITDPDAEFATKQHGLGAIQSAVAIFGASHPSSFLSMVGSVLELIGHENPSFKASALITVAALIKGLKTEMVSYLPKFVPVVLELADAAASKLIVIEASCDPDGEMKESSVGDPAGVALDLASSLTVIQELVLHLGAFISPYVQQILGIALNPKVLGFTELGCGELARAIGSSIPRSVPPRLMFEPMFDRFDAAVQGGEQSLIQLLEVVGVLASRLDPKSAANYSEQIFRFLLRGLEIRQCGSLSLAATHAVEGACITAFLQLVMKLSEKHFRPLFERLVAWSHLKAEDPQRKNLGRQVSFCRLVGDLAKRLRSMFVAYFDHFLEDAVKVMLGIEATSKHDKKKKKLNADGGGALLRQRQEVYQLRLYLVRAVHRCALYDNVGFLTPEKIDEVGPALVHQVKLGEASSDVTTGLEFLAPELDLEGDCVAAEVDVLGTATVASLVKLAVVGGSEETWRSLNSKVVKASRKRSQYVRILVLEFEKHLINMLKEDFLPMVPEALPRLAEFLEDSEALVSNRARDVIGLLEKLSGESYDQYLK